MHVCEIEHAHCDNECVIELMRTFMHAISLSTIVIRLVRGVEIMEMKAAQHGCMLGVKG